MSKLMRTMAFIGLLTIVVLAAVALGGAASAGAITYQRCAKVLEAKTGNYTESKCLTEGANAEWIRADFPGTVLNATEECARVTQAGTGMWTDSECKSLQAENKGEYVRLALASGIFTGTSGLSRLVAGANTIKCLSDTSSGSLSGKDAVSKLVVSYKSCKLESAETITCKTTGAAEGEIVTASLTGKLGYVEVLGKKVGVLLKPEAGEEFTKGEIMCGLLAKIKVRGSVIGEVTPINTFSTKSTQSFKIVEGKQQWTEIQIEELPQTAKLEYSLNGGAFAAALEETVEELTFAESAVFRIVA
jgi:hypothetical protein